MIAQLFSRAALCLLAGLIAMPVFAQNDDLQRTRERLATAEARVETLRRFLPPERDGAAQVERMREVAVRAGLTGLTVHRIPGHEQALAPDGKASPVELERIELSGRAPWGTVHHFLSLLSYLPRLTPLERLRVEAAPEDEVTFEARIALPFLPFDDTGAPLRDPVAELQRRAQRAESAFAVLIAWVKGPDPLAPLPMLDDAVAEQAVAFSSIRLQDGLLELDGALLGGSAEGALMRGLEVAGLEVVRKQLNSMGECRAFNIAARPPAAELPSESIGGNGQFDSRIAATCKPAAGELKTLTIRGPEATGPSEPVLRLRDVDVADLFSVLQNYLAADFVVDADVTGRITLEVDDSAGVEDLYTALPGAGFIVGPEPLRRVSRRPPTGGDPAPDGLVPDVPVSFLFKKADLLDVLCVVSAIAEKDVLVEPGARGTVTIFADETPASALFEAMLASNGLRAVSDRGRIVVRSAGAGGGPATPACESSSSSSPSPLDRVPRRLDALPLADLRLVGVGRVGDSWRAWVYIPGRLLLPVEQGTQLLDGQVLSVSADGMAVRTKSGARVRVPLGK